MIGFVGAEVAARFFARLPAHRRIATLSPAYVCADARRDDALEPVFFLYEDGRGFWLHGAHRAAIPEGDRFDLQSPYGYGGPLSDCDDPGFRADAWCAYQTACLQQGIVVEFVRLHPLSTRQHYPGATVADRQTVVIDLADGEWRSRYAVRCRTAIRKASKSGARVVELPWGDVVGRFAEFYRDAMRRIGAGPFYLFGDDYFHALATLPGLRLLVCEHEGEWLSAGIFLSHGESMEYHLSGTSVRGREFAATNLLIDVAAAVAAAEGLSVLYLGGGTDASPDNALLLFKSGFSPRRLTYSYGYTVFDSAYYETLRARARYHGGRVLFYR